MEPNLDLEGKVDIQLARIDHRVLVNSDEDREAQRDEGGAWKDLQAFSTWEREKEGSWFFFSIALWLYQVYILISDSWTLLLIEQ